MPGEEYDYIARNLAKIPVALVAFRASRHQRVSILVLLYCSVEMLLRRNDAYGDFALSRAVKLDQNYPLPGTEDESATFRQQG